jgi:hypothetical protein
VPNVQERPALAPIEICSPLACLHLVCQIEPCIRTTPLEIVTRMINHKNNSKCFG